MNARIESERKASPLRGKWLWLTAILVIVVTAAIHFRAPARVQVLLQAALDQVRQLGAWAPVLFILLYIVSCMAVIPASVLTIGGGALFGVVQGSIYVSIAATLGATAAFLMGRYLARDWITRKLGAHPAFVAIDKSVAEEGWRIVFLTRLCPIFPFFLMNYAYGLTRISLRDYVLATWIGIIPGSTLFVYIGSLALVGDQQSSPMGWALKGFILVTAVLAFAYLAKVARRVLSSKIAPPGIKSPKSVR